MQLELFIQYFSIIICDLTRFYFKSKQTLHLYVKVFCRNLSPFVITVLS